MKRERSFETIAAILILQLLGPTLNNATSWHDQDVGIVSSCPDEEPYCPVAAERGHCLGDIREPDGSTLLRREPSLAVLSLSKCRQSCIRFFEERPWLLEEVGWISELVEVAGGLGDEWNDMLGYTHTICSRG